MAVAFRIPGTVPSKKNGKMLTRGRTITDPVKQRELATLTMLIRSQWRRQPVTDALVQFDFELSSKAGDLDNKVTSLLDCMKNAGVIVDDSVAHIREIQARRVFVRKGCEGVVVSVEGETA